MIKTQQLFQVEIINPSSGEKVNTNATTDRVPTFHSRKGKAKFLRLKTNVVFL